MSIVHESLYIDGWWTVLSSTDTIAVVSPSTEQTVGQVPQAAPRHVDAAVAAAHRALDDPTGWSAWDVDRRADVLDRFATAYLARQEEFAQRVSIQNGMPISTSRQVETAYPPALLPVEPPADPAVLQARSGVGGGVHAARQRAS